MNLNEYEELFINKKSGTAEGLCGRIIRGTKPEDFETLTDDPERKLVMLMGPDGLEKLLGKDSYDMLIEIGYERDYIQRKLDEGNQFKIVVFKEGGEAVLADWFNVLRTVSKTYPEISSKIQRHLSPLKNTPFSTIETAAGYDFSEVDKNGKEDPYFMTYEKYKTSPDTLVAARAFLYFTVHLRELFHGDGYTYTADGDKGLMEYIVANKELSEIGDHIIIDINF